ncbi:hypothetical protein Ciccas_013696 [Cichlidogyrus casuarinus]|uniref:Uncharacterized protein n=1 Tax=Cichlidogyrus casuarinus TaxID=1844966 RepID=A0ABD2PK01_9PLAT
MQNDPFPSKFKMVRISTAVSVLVVFSILLPNVHCCIKNMKIKKCYEDCLGASSPIVQADCKEQLGQISRGERLVPPCKQHLPQIRECTKACRPTFALKVDCIRNCFGPDSTQYEESCAGEWSKLVDQKTVSQQCQPYQTKFNVCDVQCKGVGTYEHNEEIRPYSANSLKY